MTILSQELFIIVDKLIQKQSDIERRSERKLFKMKHHYFKILNFLLLRYFQFSFRAGGGGCFVSIGRSFLIPAATCATLLHYQIGSTVGLSSLPVPTTSAESRRIPLEKIFDAKREYLFTTRKNIRNFEWTTEEAEDLFEDILDIDEMANIGGSLELGSITIIKKGTTAKIGENSCLYDVHDGQQRLVSLSLLLAAIRDTIYEKYPDAKDSATDVARMIYPKKRNCTDVTRIELREKNGNKWLKCILSRTDPETKTKMKDDEDIMKVLPEERSWKKFQQESDRQILTIYNYYRKRIDDLENEEKILNLLDRFGSNVYFLVFIPSDTIIARSFVRGQGKGKNMEPVDEFKGIVCFDWNENEQVQDSMRESWEDLCEDVSRNTLQDACLILAQQSLRTRLKKNGEVQWMQQYVKERMMSDVEYKAETLFKTEIVPAAKALEEFRSNGNFYTDDSIRVVSHPPSLNFLRSIAEIPSCKEIEMVVLYFILIYDDTTDEEMKKLIINKLKDIECIALWMMLAKPKPKDRFQRCLLIIEEHENKDNIAAVSSSSTSSLTNEEQRLICNALETTDFGKGATDRKKATAILERLNEYELVKKHQSKLQPIKSSLNIEHILPQKHNKNVYWMEHWQDDDDISFWQHKIGNLALLNQKINSKIGNNCFEIKKKHLKESPYPLTKEIAANDALVWDVHAVQDNHKRYINLAKEVWNIQA